MAERFNKKNLLTWAAIIPLAICLIYSLFYLARGTILSRPLDDAVWGVAIFILLAGLGYNLELNMVKGYYRSYLGIGLLVTILGLAIAAISTILGFIGFAALVPISILILILCLVFSVDFFGVDRIPFILRVLAGALVVGLLVAVAVFLFLVLVAFDRLIPEEKVNPEELRELDVIKKEALSGDIVSFEDVLNKHEAKRSAQKSPDFSSESRKSVRFFR